MTIIDIFSFIGGFSAKLYDDIEDNNYLSIYKNPFTMELLKGLHYLSFISVGMEDNLFYFISYVANVFNMTSNNEAFSKPYEKSLLYIFLFGLLLLNYAKMYEEIISFNVYSFDTLALIYFLCSMFAEPLFISSDVSLTKLCVRISSSLIFLFLYFMCNTQTPKHIIIYVFGYLSCSSFIQYISLREEIKHLKKIKKENENYNEENNGEKSDGENSNKENKNDEDEEDKIDLIIDHINHTLGLLIHPCQYPCQYPYPYCSIVNPDVNHEQHK